jgi:5,10-methenyltetrahydrofolate synthetase
MKSLSVDVDLEKIMFECDAVILYEPLASEINYRENFPFKIPKNIFILPNDKKSDPFEWADKCVEALENKKVFILVPGKDFDVYGTRHGHGRGWYDRFLSKVPKGWLRVGIAYQHQISKTRLIKKEWDQSVDWLMILSNNNWEIYKKVI